MKCYTYKDGVITKGIRVERASISGGTREIEAVQVGNRARGGMSTLVSVHERSIPPDKIVTNAINIITRSGKHGLSPTTQAERDTYSGCIVLFQPQPPTVGDLQYYGECIKEARGLDGVMERHFIPFPGTVIARGTVVREEPGRLRTVADQIMAVLPRGVVASISTTARPPEEVARFFLYDGQELLTASIAERRALPKNHALSEERCQHFLALNKEAP